MHDQPLPQRPATRTRESANTGLCTGACIDAAYARYADSARALRVALWADSACLMPATSLAATHIGRLRSGHHRRAKAAHERNRTTRTARNASNSLPRVHSSPVGIDVLQRAGEEHGLRSITTRETRRGHVARAGCGGVHIARGASAARDTALWARDRRRRTRAAAPSAPPVPRRPPPMRARARVPQHRPHAHRRADRCRRPRACSAKPTAHAMRD